MAKMRVFELAKELNMTNRSLLEKIQGMELPSPVTSHMSGLDEESVDLIKANLAAPKPKNVEEKRIGSRVIRRRRKPAAKREAAEEAPPPEESAEEAPHEAPVEAPPEVEAEAPAAPAETEAPEAPPEEAAEAPKAKKKPAKKAKVESPARIVKPVVKAEEPVEAEEPAEPEEAAEAAPEPVEVKAEEPAAEAPEAAPEPEPEKPAEAADAAKKPAEAPEAPKEGEAEAAQEAAPEKAAEADKPAKAKKKKKKGEQAAKIISLPEHPVEFEHVPPPVNNGAAAAPAGDADAKTEAGDRKKKKKGRRQTQETEVDSRFFKKKVGYRKREVVEGADLYDQRSGRMRRGRKGGRERPRPTKTMTTTPKAIKRRVKVDEAILLSDLAKRMGIKASELIKKLMGMGTMATVNQSLDFETASILAAEFGYETERAGFEEETLIKAQEDAPDSLKGRPPVVTIMGHVDHGKTSLLDAIRETRVTDGEAGGITQHIGAYMVETDRGQISFLDTPGHEAFTAMRARGASVTDIVVLVVAADDGVMPQTVEAVDHSKAAGVPIIVAVNKMDKPEADPVRVTRELAEKGLSPEDWGGDTIFVEVSAKKKTGLDTLLEMILLQAEMLELSANPDKPARGHVVEARMDPGRGPVATILVKEGTLHTGDAIVCGQHYGKVRAMINDRGEPIDVAGPSHPAEILGLSGVPLAGDEIVAVDTEKDAKQVAEHRAQKNRMVELAKTTRPTLENLFERIGQSEQKELNLIVKADVQGSVEALKESLEKLSGDEVRIDIVHAATGTVTESDVSLAAVSEAIIIAFNVRPQAKVADMATEEGVDIRYYDVIYHVIDDIKKAVVGMMDSTYEERLVGRADVRDTFTIPKVGTIAGSYITDGKAERGMRARLVRDGVVVHDGRVGSLRRFKDDVKEVQSGYECGIGLDNYNDIKVGDQMEFYFLEEIKPALD